MAFTIITELDIDALTAVVDQARASTTDQRWLVAIDKAYDYLLTTAEPLQYDAETHILLVPSATSATVYRANGVCQCKAHENGNACWHRAAGRLVQRVVEAQAQQQQVETREERFRREQAEVDTELGITNRRPDGTLPGTYAEPDGVWQPSYGRPDGDTFTGERWAGQY